jgi:hypothetical protein
MWQQCMLYVKVDTHITRQRPGVAFHDKGQREQRHQKHSLASYEAEMGDVRRRAILAGGILDSLHPDAGHSPS